MIITKKEILALEKVKRLNIINSITGVKPGNLIGTKSKEGNSNLAIISSVVHLGSNPALLGFVLRPQTVRRDTHNNIVETGYYTVNHIPTNKIRQAHYTSVKFDKEVSEFQKCDFNEYYIEDFLAPFVAESPVQIGMKYLETIEIKSNNTALIIGSVEMIKVKPELIGEEGYIDLEKANSVGIGGLNQYYKLNKIGEFPFAREKELPKF